MATLIFIGTIIALLIVAFKIILNLSQHKPIWSSVRMLIIILLSYFLLWVFFYLLSSDRPVPFGTDICFDDWCATITEVEVPGTSGVDSLQLNLVGQLFIVHIKMTNKARGIAQKPSEPRVKIIDRDGNSYVSSIEGQQALEESRGRQIPFDARLELHQSLETQLVFEIPQGKNDLKAVIEEGPLITRLLFYSDREIFLLNSP